MDIRRNTTTGLQTIVDGGRMYTVKTDIERGKFELYQGDTLKHVSQDMEEIKQRVLNLRTITVTGYLGKDKLMDREDFVSTWLNHVLELKRINYDRDWCHKVEAMHSEVEIKCNEQFDTMWDHQNESVIVVDEDEYRGNDYGDDDEITAWSEAKAVSDECSCGRGDGCDCDGMEEKARADEEEGRREADAAQAQIDHEATKS